MAFRDKIHKYTRELEMELYFKKKTFLHAKGRERTLRNRTWQNVGGTENEIHRN